MSMSSLEALMDRLAGTPGELRRYLEFVKVEDERWRQTMEKLKAKQKEYINAVTEAARNLPKDGSVDLKAATAQPALLAEIEALRAAALGLSEEKMATAAQAYDLVETQLSYAERERRKAAEALGMGPVESDYVGGGGGDYGEEDPGRRFGKGRIARATSAPLMSPSAIGLGRQQSTAFGMDGAPAPAATTSTTTAGGNAAALPTPLAREASFATALEAVQPQLPQAGAALPAAWPSGGGGGGFTVAPLGGGSGGSGGSGHGSTAPPAPPLFPSASTNLAAHLGTGAPGGGGGAAYRAAAGGNTVAANALAPALKAAAATATQHAHAVNAAAAAQQQRAIAAPSHAVGAAGLAGGGAHDSHHGTLGGGGAGTHAAGGIPAAAIAAAAAADDSEPRYCICNGPAYGEMVGCDDSSCEKEWFHLECVGLKVSPSGKWFCPACRNKKKPTAASRKK